MSNPHDYTIGWICAIKTEYVAAQVFLDEKHDGPETVSANDSNDYTLGKIGKHNVAIAVLPSGEYGLSSAAVVASNMRSSFPNVRIGLMVGIGGGAPSQRHDIRLGDIVVSAPSDGGSGVFQYDFGDTIQNQSFKTTGFLNQSPTVLRTAVSGLQTQYEMEGHQLEEAINDALNRYKRLQKTYSRQGQTTDRLYKTGVVHPSGLQGSCDSICGSDPSSLVIRPQRTEDEDNPTIHYGLIASANNLMKDALLRDALAEEKDVLCFEMEAAGLMNHFPCLVIRGICDYADSHKNKEWQGYAAMAAAAYTKDLIKRMAPNRVAAEKKIGDILPGVIVSTLSSTIGHVETIKSKLVGDKNLEILNWLTTTNYGPQQSDYINRRQKGTGQWLLSSPEYQAWFNGGKKTLLCQGIPGAGKTILTSVVIEDLTLYAHQNDLEVGIAYIYCNFRSHDQQRYEDLLASLLKQLSEQRRVFPDCLEDLFTRHTKKHSRPSLDEISKNLQSVAAMYSKVFIIVDALDECQEKDDSRKKLLTQIFHLQSSGEVRFFATSRHIPNITDNFPEDTRLEVRATEEDLRTYLEGQISLLPACLQRNPQLIEEVKVAILQAVEGMFLLAQLHLESLKGETRPKGIREALKKLPTGSEAYDKSYEEAMSRIEKQNHPQHRELGNQVIAWISCAKRPLTSSELEHALAVNSGDSKLDMENICQVEDMMTFCAGLVTVDKKSGIIRLVHYTTQEFFQRTKTKWFPNIQTDITNVCATYLSLADFESGHCQSDEEFEERMNDYPLYDYASHYWGVHAREANISSSELITFLEKTCSIQASGQALFVVKSSWMREYSNRFPKKVTALHLIAYFGVQHVVRRFLPEGTSDLKDDKGRTPLSWAAENGRTAIVKLLLDTGKVDVDSKGSNDRTPLSWAAEKGHEAIVKLLLDTGKVDVDSKDSYNRSPLSWAAEYGHEVIVKLLLDTGNVDIDSKDSEYGRTPLSWAAENGRTAIVKLLLDTGKVDVNSKDSNDRTPVSWAAENGRTAIVKLLLDTGKVDVDLKDTENRRTPLSWAAENGHEAIVKLLLDTGKVDVDSKDSNDRAPLSWAAEYGHEAIVKLLLDTGKVEVDSKDLKYNQTPLSWTAENGHEAIVKLLLDTGKVNVDSKDSYNQTPLSWAAKNGHEAVVKLLLGTGKVKVDSKDSYNQTPLSWAAENGHEAVVKLLLGTGKVDVDSKDSFDRTPLSRAAEYGHGAVVKLLVDTGKVDVNSKDSNFDRTPLSLAAERGHEAVVKLLLDTGKVDVDSKDSIFKRTPLSWATSNGHEAVVKLLLDTGKVDVDSKDSIFNRTPLSWAASNGHEAVLKLLLDTGKVDVDSEDSNNQTPLSWAAENGHEAVVKLLLDTGKVDVDLKDTE